MHAAVIAPRVTATGVFCTTTVADTIPRTTNVASNSVLMKYRRKSSLMSYASRKRRNGPEPTGGSLASRYGLPYIPLRVLARRIHGLRPEVLAHRDEIDEEEDGEAQDEEVGGGQGPERGEGHARERVDHDQDEDNHGEPPRPRAQMPEAQARREQDEAEEEQEARDDDEDDADGRHDGDDDRRDEGE